MPRREFEGRTAAEAAIKACDELGVRRALLRYEIVSETGEAFERRVVIAVDTDRLPPPEEADSAAEASSGRDERPRGRGRRDDRGGGRGRRDDRGGSRGRRDDRGGRRGAEGSDIDSLLNLEAMPAQVPEERPELTGEVSARARQAKEVLGELLRLSGLGLSPAVVQDDAEEIHLDLRGADTARIIGDKGDALLALQFLVNRMVSRHQDGDAHVVLDAASYRVRRRAALAELARQLAEKACAEKKVVRLSPMSAHDRRIFHITLQEHEGVSTRSEGEGLFRPLLIIPAGE